MEYTDDAYKVLGVEPTATEAEIKKAYRKLALQHHPDRVNDPAGKAKANAVFAKIAHAYEVCFLQNSAGASSLFLVPVTILVSFFQS